MKGWAILLVPEIHRLTADTEDHGRLPPYIAVALRGADYPYEEPTTSAWSVTANAGPTPGGSTNGHLLDLPLGPLAKSCRDQHRTAGGRSASDLSLALGSRLAQGLQACDRQYPSTAPEKPVRGSHARSLQTVLRLP